MDFDVGSGRTLHDDDQARNDYDDHSDNDDDVTHILFPLRKTGPRAVEKVVFPRPQLTLDTRSCSSSTSTLTCLWHLVGKHSRCE